eukprot:6481420-Pyramimonas_sp.AAC.1
MQQLLKHMYEKMADPQSKVYAPAYAAEVNNRRKAKQDKEDERITDEEDEEDEGRMGKMKDEEDEGR